MTDQISSAGNKRSTASVTRRGFMRAAGIVSIGAGIGANTADAQTKEPWEDVRDHWTIKDDKCKNCILLICDETFNDLFTDHTIWAKLAAKADTRIPDKPTDHRTPIKKMLNDLAKHADKPVIMQLYKKNKGKASSKTQAWPTNVSTICDQPATNNIALPFFWVPDDEDETKTKKEGKERTKVKKFLDSKSGGNFMSVFGHKTFYSMFTRPVDSTQEQMWRLHLLRTAKDLGITRIHPVERARIISTKLAAKEALTKGKCGRYNGFDWVCEDSDNEDDLCGITATGELEQGSDLCP